jgi:hypothetical protein
LPKSSEFKQLIAVRVIIAGEKLGDDWRGTTVTIISAPVSQNQGSFIASEGPGGLEWEKLGDDWRGTTVTIISAPDSQNRPGWSSMGKLTGSKVIGRVPSCSKSGQGDVYIR